jgi:hypothetical protein
VRLHGPSLDAASGLTLGGVTWDGSTDGNAVGSPPQETLARESNGWRIDLPAYDAVVITITP